MLTFKTDSVGVPWDDEIDNFPPLIPETTYAVVPVKVLEEMELRNQSAEAVNHMAVARLGGFVEGEPTKRINFLQRIDELRETEREALELVCDLGAWLRDAVSQGDKLGGFPWSDAKRGEGPIRVCIDAHDEFLSRLAWVASPEEVRAYLKANGIDVTPAVERVKRALAAAREEKPC